MAKDGWIVPLKEGEQPTGVSKMRNPKEPSVDQAVIVASEFFPFLNLIGSFPCLHIKEEAQLSCMFDCLFQARMLTHATTTTFCAQHPSHHMMGSCRLGSMWKTVYCHR